MHRRLAHLDVGSESDRIAMVVTGNKSGKTKHKKPIQRRVRFSRTVEIREYGLAIGDMRLCEATPHCPRICRHNPLPVVSTDEVLKEYQLPIDCWGYRSLSPQTMESQVQRLVACGYQRQSVLRLANEYWHEYNVIHTAATLQRAFSRNAAATALVWKIEDDDDAQAEEDTTRVESNGDVPAHVHVVRALLQLQRQMHSEGTIGDVQELARYYKKLQKKHCSTRPFRKKAKALHVELTGEKDAVSSARSVLTDILNFTAPKTSSIRVSKKSPTTGFAL